MFLDTSSLKVNVQTILLSCKMSEHLQSNKSRQDKLHPNFSASFKTPYLTNKLNFDIINIIFQIIRAQLFYKKYFM